MESLFDIRVCSEDIWSVEIVGELITDVPLFRHRVKLVVVRLRTPAKLLAGTKIYFIPLPVGTKTAYK